MSNIRLSPKYGVNPSLDTCFFCRESIGVVLMGYIKGDLEAPRTCISSYEPCEACKEKFKQGFLIIEALPDRTFTGNYWLIKTERAIEAFGLENVAEGKVLITEQDAKALGLYDE